MTRAETSTTWARATRSTAEARLAMTEFLLGCDEVDLCVNRCLEWLSRQAGVNKAMCLAVDRTQQRLFNAGSWGVPDSELQGFYLELEEQSHPLVKALSRTRPFSLDAAAAGYNRLPSVFGEGAYAAVPLLSEASRGRRSAAGLLLISPGYCLSAPDVSWLCELLGRIITRRLGLRSLREVEQTLRRDHSLLSNTLNAVHDPIILTDTAGRLIVSNRAAELLLGAREEESEGKRRAVALNNMFLSAALSSSALEGPASSGRELLLVNPDDGSDLFFECVSISFSDVHEGTGIVTVLRNVGDLRRTTQELEENFRKLRLAEAEVRAERDRLDSIISSVAEPVLVTGPEGKIIMMNDPAERLFTLPAKAPAEVLQCVQANDAHFSSFLSSLFMGGQQQHQGGISLLDPQKGAPVPVEAVAAKIISEQGEIMGVVTILHDRTEAIEKARLYEQLQQASEKLEEKVREATAELVRQNEVLRRQHIELEQAVTMKSQFLANVSHELRTPLNSIIGYTRLLLQGVSGELRPQQTANLSRVDSNARNLLSLINQLLDITRMEAGKMPLDLQTISIRALISEVVSEMEPLIAQTKLNVTTELPEIPGMRSDPEKIKQILVNLLMNALKFTPQGWVKLTAAYSAPRDEVTITVADSGIGIAATELDQIFEDFRRSEASVASGYPGVGLGLSIGRRLAHLLGGKLKVASKLGEGSSFHLILPRETRVP